MKKTRDAFTLLLSCSVVWVAWSCAAPDRTETSRSRVMQGLYRYMADAALFTDCQTGESFPVAFEGDNRALEAAYLNARHQPGEPLLVTLRARVLARAPMEGPGTVPTLIPDQFISISKDQSCAVSGRATLD